MALVCDGAGLRSGATIGDDVSARAWKIRLGSVHLETQAEYDRARARGHTQRMRERASERERERPRHPGTQTGQTGQTGGHADSWTHRRTDAQTHRRTDRRTDRVTFSAHVSQTAAPCFLASAQDSARTCSQRSSTGFVALQKESSATTHTRTHRENESKRARARERKAAREREREALQ